MNLEYDALHRLIRKKHGTTTVAEYTYDGTAANNAIGRLITDTDGVAGSGADHSDYTYDPLGRSLTANRTVSGTAYNIGYLYDFMGNLTQLTYPSGRKVSYTYTSANELNKVSDTTSTSFDYVTGASYSPLGTLQQLNLANQVTTTLGWNNLARLTSILTQKSGNPALLNFAYTYFANGQIQQITNNLDSLKTEKYSYDDLGRLLTAQRGPDNNIQRKYQYDHDRFGNRWAQDLVGGSGFPGANTFDYANNRVTSPSFSFDANGNMTNDGANTMTYDAENRAVSAAGTTYAYDGGSLRVRKCAPNCTSPTSSTVYIFSGTKVIAEYDNGAAPASPSREYIYSGSALAAKIEAGATTYFHADHLSARVLTDSSGTVIGQQGHFPFGESWYGSSVTKWKFTTYERDPESGNDYAMLRSYVNRLARFSSPDLLAGSISDPQSLNRFAYTLNDPANLIDPLGLVVHPVPFALADDPAGILSCGYAEMHGFSETGYYVVGSFCGAGSASGSAADTKTGGGGQKRGSAQKPAPKQKFDPCDAKLPSDADATLLSRLIFAEATRVGISPENSAKEMAAIASTVINRADYLQQNPNAPLSFFGASDRSIQGVVTPSQFASLNSANFTRAGAPAQINIATASGKRDCDFLKSAIRAAEDALAGTIGDPFGSLGGVYGFRTAGHGPPGGRFFPFPPEAQIPGAGNTFFGLGSVR